MTENWKQVFCRIVFLQEEQLGANAVMELRFDSSDIGQIMTEIVAYGTAVVVEDASTHFSDVDETGTISAPGSIARNFFLHCAMACGCE